MGLVIDNVHIIDTAKFAAMKKAEAVKTMIDDGFVPGTTATEKKEWAEKAYSLIKPEKKSPEPEAE